MHEGFHGTLYEMADALRIADPTIFNRQLEIDRADPRLIEGAKWFARFDPDHPDLIDPEEYEQFFSHHLAALMYRYVVGQMIDVIVDETSRIVNNRIFSPRIRLDGVGDSLPILKSIMDDMILCIEYDDDDTIKNTPFNREFFYSKAPEELKDLPESIPMPLPSLTS